MADDFRKDVNSPKAGRPRMPGGYGVPGSVEGTLPWSFAEERLEASRNYWIGTTRPDGRPHAMPVWGVWVGNRLYFSSSPETRRSRNLSANPAVIVHLESGDQVVIVEGEARDIRALDRSLAETIASAFALKYADSGYSPSPEEWDNGGLYVVHPRKAFAWTKFPQDTTRWEF